MTRRVYKQQQIERLENLLRFELADGERVVWTGKPRPLAFGWRMAGPSLMVTGLLLGTASVMMYFFAQPQSIIIGSPLAGFLMLFGFVALFLYIFVRDLAKFTSGWKTLYILTNHRMMIRQPGKALDGFDRSQLHTILARGPDRHGDYLLASGGWKPAARGSRWVAPIGIIAVDGTDQLAALIRANISTGASGES